MTEVIQIGVVAAPTGAIVTVRQEPSLRSVVVGIEEHPLSIGTLADRVLNLASELPDAQFILDGAGVGSALWAVLFGEAQLIRETTATRQRLPGGAPVAWLYETRGLDRQQLINELVSLEAQGLVRFEHGLAGFEALQTALVGYSPHVGEDGRIGSALVVALCLALLPRLIPPQRLGAFLA